MRRAVMENSEEVKGPEMNTRNWLLVIVVDVLILVELAAAMYVASVHPDEFELMFMKSFFGMLIPTLVLSFLYKRMLRRAPEQLVS
jgi:membrane protein CcdC involved in cytochrome C biogenesis